ncbi:MAG: hypothetical protein ACM3Q1_11440 [Bacteroidales bacterium]
MADDADPDAEAVARADAALAALTADYLRWVARDIDTLKAAVAGLAAAGSGQWADSAQRIVLIAHDIKGQGTTFGYPLMTRLGQAVCEAARAAKEPCDGVLARLDALVAAMSEVLASRLGDDSGPQARDLLSRAGLHPPGLWAKD